jgi:flagellum-specific peptidoglycan hydrolase FlgJ
MIRLNIEHALCIIAIFVLGMGCRACKKAYDNVQDKNKSAAHVSNTQMNLDIYPDENPTTPAEIYIARFKKVAQSEQKRYGIPASITLAQGLLESNKGMSSLASKHNNHFGIKCWCHGRHSDCVNFADDSPTDRFKRYKTAWESYRHHSEVVSSMPLKIGSRASYKDWARALKKAGYATNPRYAQDLINIIERYELHRYDVASL